MKTTLIMALSAIMLSMGADSLQASSATWLNSGTSANFSSGGNWVGGTAPGSTTGTTTDVATFSTAVGTVGTSGNPILIDQSTQYLGGITFSGAAGSYTVGTNGGNSLLLGSPTVNTVQIGTLTGSSLVTETIAAPLTLESSGFYFTNNSASGSGAGSGVLDITGSITNSGGGNLTLSGSNTNANTISGNITTSGAIVVSGGGAWTLSGTNSYSNATVYSGILNVSSIGTGGNLASNKALYLGNSGTTGTLNYTGSAAASITNATYFFVQNGVAGGGGELDNNGSGTLTVSAPIYNTGSDTGSLTLGGSGTGVLSGSFQHVGPLSLVMNGTGTWTVSGANGDVSGGVTINSGTLKLGNAAATGTTTNALSVTGGTLDLAGYAPTVGALTLGTAGNAGSTLTDSSTAKTLTTTGVNVYGTGNTINSGVTVSGGGTINSGGALAISSGATWSGTLTVVGTLAGTGTTTGTTFAINGSSSSSVATVLVGHTTTSDVNTSSALTMTGSANPATSGSPTISNANLVFNLNANVAGGLGSAPSGLGVSTSGNALSVANSAIYFGSSVTLTLDLQNETSGVTPNTPYVLIAGTEPSGGAGVNNSQYGGLTLGTVLVSSGTVTETVISGSNLGYAFGSTSDQQSYGTNSELVLYQNTSSGVDDIDILVVPEPGTWALMLGGLAGLIFLQRRRSKLR